MTVVDQFVELFKPWHTDQGAVFAPDLVDFITTFAEMFEPYETYAEDEDDGTTGYSRMLDPQRAPVEGLPWLAQWVGERLPTGLTEDQMRQWILDAPNQIRGTKKGIARAAQRKLTGTKTVALHPRFKSDGTADVDWLTVFTLESETPDPNGVREDVLSVMPADIELDYAAVSEAIWSTVETYGTWADVAGAGTWADVASAAISTAGGWYVYTAADTTLAGGL